MVTSVSTGDSIRNNESGTEFEAVRLTSKGWMLRHPSGRELLATHGSLATELFTNVTQEEMAQEH